LPNYTYSAIPWAAIFSTPMRQTIDTAKLLSETIGIKHELREGLKEINYGKWEGKTPQKINAEYHNDYIVSH
jgi:probable phosphoglycerate mutase